jgi:hypothetical protein
VELEQLVKPVELIGRSHDSDLKLRKGGEK